eukprot:scaffold15654_cov66-Phaeocystis_antarctica.AAC.2
MPHPGFQVLVEEPHRVGHDGVHMVRVHCQKLEEFRRRGRRIRRADHDRCAAGAVEGLAPFASPRKEEDNRRATADEGCREQAWRHRGAARTLRAHVRVVESQIDSAGLGCGLASGDLEFLEPTW